MFTFRGYGGNIIFQQDRYPMQQAPLPRPFTFLVKSRCITQSRRANLKNSTKLWTFQVYFIDSSEICLMGLLEYWHLTGKLKYLLLQGLHS